MPSTATASLALPLLVAEQAQKHVTHNEALKLLDVLVRTEIVDRDLTVPPGAPVDGAVYIPASGATGAWSAWDLNLAVHMDGVWQKIVPKVGWLVYVVDEDVFLKFEGAPSYWVEFSSGTGGGGGGGSGRELLTADRTYYVRTDGDDGNDGLSNSTGGAFLTIQKFIDLAATLDLNGHDVYCQVDAGTYTDPVVLKSLVGGTGIIIGDETTPSNVLIDITGGNCFTADGVMSPWDLRGMKLQTSGSQAAGIRADNGSVVRFQNIDFGAQGTYDIIVNTVSSVQATGNYTISAGKAYHLALFNNAVFLRANGSTITLTGTPAWGTAFLLVTSSSVATMNGLTFSGSATGVRYSVSLNGVINTAGGGASYLPGDSAGSTATGGQYV